MVCGGGIVGCSVAYHLAKLGWKDVLLLEQGRYSKVLTFLLLFTLLVIDSLLTHASSYTVK